MRKGWFLEEVKSIIPAVCFFLVAFTLGDWTDRLMNKDAMTTYSYISIIVAALVMGKVVLISDHMPFINHFANKPLIYNTIWKTLIYVMCAGFFRLLEHAIPAIYHGDGMQAVYETMVSHIDRPVFWLAHAWLTALFLIFVAYRELIELVGKDKVYQAFFKTK